ncbi:MAG TPA: hypothetical protein VFB33_03085 [Candidatus Binataceae bacterium]|jgi:hypothetical protein|nr:hypothetical protein [Candidatus Binataceae bacterium]
MSNKIDERMSTADGLLAGLFGAVVVIASFMLLDMARGAVVAAPAPEGGADLTAYFWRTMATGGMLFAAFSLIGVAGEWLLRRGERDASRLPPITVFVAALFVFAIVGALLLGPAAEHALPWWKVMLAALAGGAAMIGYLLSREPVLAHDAWQAWHGLLGRRVEVICPETRAPTMITVDQRSGWIQSCARWPARYTCARNCVERRPETDQPQR